MKKVIFQLLTLILTLFVISSITFVLMKMIPGDPFTDEKGIPAEIHLSLQKHYGLDESWPRQYWKYMKSIAMWDLGPSFRYQNRTINQIINESFPISAKLGLMAVITSTTLGICFGVISALKNQKWQDCVIMIGTTAAISIPSFILATLLQYFLAMKLGLFPIARWETFMSTILPVIALSALPTAFITRLMKSNMLETLRQEYIQTAKAKGLSRCHIIVFHALRNSLLPIIAYLGQLIANVLVGSFIIEKIFAIPGLGQWFVNSISNRDYTAIMGLTVFYSIILLTTICLSEMAYTLLDPRIKKTN